MIRPVGSSDSSHGPSTGHESPQTRAGESPSESGRAPTQEICWPNIRDQMVGPRAFDPPRLNSLPGVVLETQESRFDFILTRRSDIEDFDRD